MTQQRPASVIVCADPFQTVIEPHQVRAALDDETLADMAPAAPGSWLCIVNDRIIPSDLWHYMPPRGAVVQWRCQPQGGGDDNGGGSRAVLMIIAIIAINYFTAGMGSGWTASLYRVGLTIAAQALINNLVPLGAPGAGAERRYTGQAQGNIARLGAPIPEGFGFNNDFPELAAQPYNTFTRTEQTLHVLLCLGVGQYHICRVSNGDTDLRYYDDVDIVRVGPGQSTMDGPGTGYEALADQSVIDPRWVTSQDASLVELRPGKYAGPFTVCGPGRTVDLIGADLVQPRGQSLENQITWRHEARLIDDFEQPLGPWFVLGSHMSSSKSISVRYFAHEYAVPPGRYEFRAIRTDGFTADDLEDLDQLSLMQLRGHVVDGDISVSGCTFIGVRVRVTGQINGALRFRVMSYRMLPVWNGSSWSAPQLTRNPAWAFAQVQRTRGVSDARIDLAQLLALAPVWDARYDSFDYKFGEQISTWDALTMIARVGRAAPLIRGSRYTVVRDGPQTLPVMHYGMRNIRRGSMRLKPTLASSDQMRTLDLEYMDHRRPSGVTVTAQIHNGTVYGYRGDAQRAALGIKMPGIIGLNHAMRTVVYTLADRYYRSIDVEYDAELDGHIPAPLDLVLFQHDVGDFGQTGDVVTWDEPTRTLQTTEPLQWDDGTHYLRLVRPTGALTLAMRVTAGADDHTAVIDAGDYAAAVAACTADERGEFEVVFEDADRERSRYVFGPAANMGALAKVRGIVPVDERRIGMRLVIEDDRVHTVDSHWIAPDELPPCTVVDDQEDPNVYWLLNNDGELGASAAIDTSLYAHAVTVSSMAQAGPAAFGSTAMKNSATSSYGQFSSVNVAWNAATEGMTLEGWSRIDQDPQIRLHLCDIGYLTAYIDDDVSPDRKRLVVVAFGQTISGPQVDFPEYPLPLNTFFHWALDWNPTTSVATFYVNGALTLSLAVTGEVPIESNVTTVSTGVSGGHPSTSAGQYSTDAVRYTRRVRRYQAPFAVPTAAPTADV
jgi:Putative phage tail protein